MTISSRELRDTVVRGLAKVGMVWALAVMAVVFMAMSAQGQYGDGAYAATADSPAAQHGAGQATSGAATTAEVAPGTAEGPRAAGIALALLLLGAGGTVLVVGAARDERELRRRYAPTSDPAAQLPMAFGLSQLA